ncbi:MAG TPA: GntR family transcriptional regulator [Anaerolineaceae bacterium]|nr:GntR family transcriptional regulator [Anaerolineaceae bacterium]
MALKKTESIIEQINQIIRSRIQQGVYNAGSRLPSETTLAVEFGVSRSSVRNAMESLVNEGVIIRRHGDGTYVNKRVFEFTSQLKNLWSFPSLIQDSGYKPSVEVLSVGTLPSTPQQAADLDISPGTMLLEFQRLFYADDKPVILSRNLIPKGLLAELDSQPASLLSIYDILLQNCGIELSYSTSDIHSIQAEEQHARYLKVPTGRPLMFFKDIFFSTDGNPVVLGLNVYNDRLLTLRLVRTRGQ